MTISIDLRVRVVSPERNVWIVFPGRGRRYYDRFFNSGRMFLELPGTKFTEEVNMMTIASYKKKSVKTLVRSNVGLSYAVQKASLEDELKVRKVEIDRNLDNYEQKPEEIGNKYNVMVGCAGKFFIGMNKGDLVVIPGKGGALSNVSIAEIASNFDPDDTTMLKRFPYERVQTREIKFLKTDALRKDFTNEVYRKLSKPPAVQWLTDALDKSSIYDSVYDNYVLGDKSRALIFAPDYDGRDPTAINDYNTASKFLVGVYSTFLNGHVDALKNATSIKQFNEDYYDRDLIANYTLDFHSPGQFGLYPTRREVAAFITGLTALSLAAGLSASSGKKIEVVNSLEENAEFNQCITDPIDYLIENISPECAKELDDLINESKLKIGLKTPAIIK